ncbi:glycosyltransferase [Clostridium sp. 19966]|uniref:glycosyltransferase n=1 Tax=Clostridium sp. 19966 TaxID=2768166 RepID=UPI0028DE6EDD|nr:glycosyltransferase [Clostridium sp. 19966]MDT8717980.1 glycosyltransferase [Clostridium sp. 19966]
MKTSIIILTYNQLAYTKKCLDSIKKYTQETTYEIIIVDNNSTDGTVEWLKSQKDLITIFNDDNLGFPKGCNLGIENSTGDNILLLNNDVIVTPHWLENLLDALYSSDKIGAVGAVSNYCSYYQSIPVSYSNDAEMIEFAQKNNLTNKGIWDERLLLIGFCMLIKKEVVEKVGYLDELFTPGNFEDDDYSLRIRLAGYKLLLCRDVFIHHYGSASFGSTGDMFYNVFQLNKKKFEDKWGFDANYSTFIRGDIINLIKADKNAALKVLEIGCACGGTLLEIKNHYKNAELFGIELNSNTTKISSLIADIKNSNIEKEELAYEENYFDYIIFADVLEHLLNPWQVLTNIKKYLKHDGNILASIPNVMHYSVIRDLLNGNWNYVDAGILDKTHLRFFTYNQIISMFKNCGYNILQCNTNLLVSTNEDIDFINSLAILSNEANKYQFSVYQYIISASKAEPIKESIVPVEPSGEYTKNRGKLFVTLFPETENVHLTKDVGMIPFLMHKYFNYNSKIVCYKNGSYPYLNKEVLGLNLDFLENTDNDLIDGNNYIKKNAKNIAVLHIFHFLQRSLVWIQTYKSLNPRGKIYLKLDANINILNYNLTPQQIEILQLCDLITVETKYLYEYLNNHWKIKVEYLPNGFYDISNHQEANYYEKENIICTAGRIGFYLKSHEILLEAFKFAASFIPDWKLKLIGTIDESFKSYLLKFFSENPSLKDRVILTGFIGDKKVLDEEYRKAKIYCQTSKLESFGISMIEAQKNGCFILTSDVISALDITDNNKYGEIFPIGSANTLAMLLIKYCTNEYLLENNCLPAQQFAYDNFYWPKICSKINDLLNNPKAD